MKHVAMVLLFCCFILPGFAQQRAFTIEDLYRLRAVDDFQISPDGKQIAFVVREDNLAKGTGNSEIYLIRTDGTDLQRMTGNPASDTSPWRSQDGSAILFLPTHKHDSQT